MSMEPETNEPRVADEVSESVEAAETEAQTEVQPEAQTEVQPEAETEAQPEAETEAQPEAETEAHAAEGAAEKSADVPETAEDAAGEAAPEAQDEAPKKRRLSVGAILAILCSLGIVGAIVFALVGNTGSYALKVNRTAYTAAEVNYEYMSVFQQYSQYSQYFGSILPDDPYTMDDSGKYETWGDFYLDQTKEKLKQLTNLCDMAERDGVTLEEDDAAQIDTWITQLKDSASQMGKDDFDAFVAENFGEGVNEQVLRDMASREILAMKYLQHYQDNYSVSDEEIEKAYDADKDTYDTYHFSYCMVTAADEGSDGAASAPSDEAMAAAKEKADAILAAAKKGDGSALDRLKAAVGDDADTPVDSAVMDGDTLTQYQVPFEDWIKDADRAAGDMTVAEQTNYGWFVILFEGRERSTTPTVNVRHILIQAEDADADGSYSDAELAAAKDQIDKIQAEWKAGEQTEDAFAELANKYSTDPGSNTNGGLYENVYEGQMVPEFNDFCFAEGRKAGDVAVISDEQYHGYHLMYFVGTGEPYTNQVIRDKLVSEGMQKFANSLTEDVTVTEGKDIGLVGLTESFLNQLKEASSGTGDGSAITEEPDPAATLEPVTEAEAEPSAAPSEEP